MTRLKDRLIEGWDSMLVVSLPLGALLMFLAWRRQRHQLNRRLKLAERGWDDVDA